METYHKIQTVYLRDPANKYKTLLDGQFALPEFEYLAGNEWLFTEKIDGTNIRVNWDGASVGIRGRTDRAQIPPFLLDKLVEILPPQRFAELYPETPMILYGEGYGARIQKGGNGYIPGDVSFILFDVKIGDVWLRRTDVGDIAWRLNVPIVPMIGSGTLAEAVVTVRDGFRSWVYGADRDAEGLVMRPAVELVSRIGKRIIAKVKTKDFKRR